MAVSMQMVFALMLPAIALFLGFWWAHRAGRYREREKHERQAGRYIRRRVVEAQRIRRRLQHDPDYASRVRERFRR